MKWSGYVFVGLELSIIFGALFLHTVGAGLGSFDDTNSEKKFNNKASSSAQQKKKKRVRDIKKLSFQVRNTTQRAFRWMKDKKDGAWNLKGRDYLSKSDPMCVLFEYPHDIKRWKEHSRTETIEDVHNPDFVKKIAMDYHFEIRQPILFEIYDIDSPSPLLKNHDFLGYAKTTLGYVVHERKVELELDMRKEDLYAMTEDQLSMRTSTEQRKLTRNGRPYIIIRAQQLKDDYQINEDRVILELSGSSIARKNWFGLQKSNPYVDVYKATDSSATDYMLVHRLEVLRRNSMPHWQRFSILFTTLSDADRERKLKFVCKNWDRRQEHKVIGEVQTSIAEIEDRNLRTFELTNPKKWSGLMHTNYGFLHIEFYDFWKTYSFLEFIMGGMNIRCSVAIDFTASNDDPRKASSLHYIHPYDGSFLNHYQQAITAVVSIIEDYNTERKFLVLGFGAKLPPPADDETSHMFYVNMNEGEDPVNDQFSVGVDGVLDAYRRCVMQIQLHGPTFFEPVIRQVVEFAQQHQDGDNYFILLILTDGQIMDMDDTKRIIIKGSRLPLSIIIVGVGGQDFSAMNELDADDIPLRVDGKEPERDIVQFVNFNTFFTRRNDPSAKTRLAKEVLAEVPRQLVTYMASRHFKPKEAQVNAEDLPPDPDDL